MDTIPQPIPLAPHPGRFVEASLIDRDHFDRRMVEASIARVYAERFGDDVRTFMPHLLAYRDTQGALRMPRCVYRVGRRSASSR